MLTCWNVAIADPAYGLMLLNLWTERRLLLWAHLFRCLLPVLSEELVDEVDDLLREVEECEESDELLDELFEELLVELLEELLDELLDELLEDLREVCLCVRDRLRRGEAEESLEELLEDEGSSDGGLSLCL